MSERIPMEECEAFGGHCFEGTGEMLTSYPPQYPQVCKHCGARRRFLGTEEKYTRVEPPPSAKAVS
jgi:hypothetical protein